MKTTGIVLSVFVCCWLKNSFAQTMAIGEHSLIICSNGTLKSWGYNSTGQLGNGTFANSYVPVAVDSLTHAIAVVSGADHSLALRSDSTVWGWGSNSFGEIGLDTAHWVTTPTRISSLQGITGISSQWWHHSMMLKSDGTVWTTGNNQNGELGDSDLFVVRRIPGQVMNINNVVAISAGHDFSLALKNDSTVWAWGSNAEGKLGIDTNTNTAPCGCRTTPQQVSNLNSIIAIAGGGTFSLALRADSTVWSWGDPWGGMLGDSVRFTNLAAPIPGLTGVVAIVARVTFAMALKSDGTVWAWGDNQWGQLGIGDTTITYHLTPVQIPTLTNVVAIAGGGRHGMALKNDGTVWNWGSNYGGEMGNGTIDTTGCFCENTNAPHQVMNLCTVLPCHLTTATIVASACNSYTSPSGNYTWNATGSYMDTLLNASGCDSIVTVNLTILTPDTSVTKNGNVLTANANGSYQWLNCDLGMSVIPGAVFQSFAPVVNGSYAVAITQNACTDTSYCHTVKPCSALFTLYPDTIPQVWIALNQASGVHPITYSWNWGDGDTSSGATPSHSYANPAYYNICLEITDSNGCNDTYCDSSTYISLGASSVVMITVNVIVPAPVGLSEPLNSSVKFGPNPVRSMLILSFSKDQALENTFSIYDLTGKKMHEEKIAPGTTRQELNISDWPQGLYLFKMNTRNGQVVKKFLKLE